MISYQTYSTQFVKFSHKWFKLINFLLFQIIWAISVFGKNDWIPVTLLLLALHFMLSPSQKKDLFTVLFVGAIGVLVDSALTGFKVFVFPHDFLIPAWLVVLWAAFALTLNHSFDWLTRSRSILQAVLGGVGGAFSYWMGYQFGAVDFSFSEVITCFILLLTWSILFPLFCFYVKRYANLV